MDAQSEHWCEAELYRLRGDLLVQERATSPAQSREEKEAQRVFNERSPVARGQQAKGLELRAARSLCRLWQQQGKRPVR